jgi:formate dehydrogenase alpha subunit
MAILEGIEQGKIRFLYVAASNPLVSFPESNRWRKALAKVECLVVQDILASELTDLAHVVLPGATFAEKGGSVTSLDQRVNPLTPAIKPVGGARTDLQILTDLYRRLAPGSVAADADVLLEEARQLGGLYGAICFNSDRGLSSCVKEPFRPADRSMTCQVATASAAPAGTMLLAGKVLHHFGTTTTYADGALAVSPAGFVELSGADAKACGVAAGDKIKVTAGSASIVAPVRISDDLPQGLLFAPYHFADLNVQQLVPAGSNLVAVTLAKA